MTKIIEVSHLNKKYGDFQAINDLNLSLEAGKIYGIIGPNGAGKSTTMSMLMGIIFPTSGSGHIKGYELGSIEAKKLMGYSPEFPSFYSDMSCLEYLIYMGTVAGLSEEAALKKALLLIKEFDLEKHMYHQVNSFSTGMKKKVGLMQAMIHQPEILLLDEPTANLDPISRNEIIETLRRLVKDTKMTVLISSHVLTELEMIVDHVVMINAGEVVLSQPIQTVHEMFKQGKLLVNTSDNEQLIEWLTLNQYTFMPVENKIRIMTTDENQCKQDLVKFIYEHQLILHELKEEVVSLDNIYRQMVEGGQHNETDI